MVHSMRQIQFYVLSDVIETEWEHFHNAIKKASLLETVIVAHDQFLKNIFKRSMQTEETHVSHKSESVKLLVIFKFNFTLVQKYINMYKNVKYIGT